LKEFKYGVKYLGTDYNVHSFLLSLKIVSHLKCLVKISSSMLSRIEKIPILVSLYKSEACFNDNKKLQNIPSNVYTSDSVTFEVTSAERQPIVGQMNSDVTSCRNKPTTHGLFDRKKFSVITGRSV